MLRHLLLPTVPPPQIPSHRRKNSRTHDRPNDNTSNIPLSKPRPAVVVALIIIIIVSLLRIMVLVLVVRVPGLLLRVLLVIRARDVEAGNIKRERLRRDERDVRARVEGLVDGQVAAAAVVAVVRVDVLGDVAQLERGVCAGRGVGDEAGEVEADVAVAEGLDAVRGDDDLELGVVGGV